MPAGVECMTPFCTVCRQHAVCARTCVRACVDHCYTILSHHLSVFIGVFLFCLTPPLFQRPPILAFSISNISFSMHDVLLIFRDFRISVKFVFTFVCMYVSLCIYVYFMMCILCTCCSCGLINDNNNVIYTLSVTTSSSMTITAALRNQFSTRCTCWRTRCLWARP